MNVLERLLQDDLDRLLDRLAAMTREGMLAECAERHPGLALRLEEAEARLSCARQNMLREYTLWRDALDECGDLWAMADLVSDQLGTAPARRAA